MIKTSLLGIVLLCASAQAQETGGFGVGPGAKPPEVVPVEPEPTPSAAPSPEPTPSPAPATTAPSTASADYQTTVRGKQRSPDFTQDRTFPGTRFWKLDHGEMQVESWWRLRKKRDQDAFHIFQFEFEVGLSPRVQLDIYENLIYENGELRQEGNQIEARIAFDPVYGRTPMNPVLYLEWHPVHLAADRAEVRLLGGGQVRPGLLGAVNLFYEQNITHGPEPTFIANPEFGFTAGASYALAGQKLRAGAEVKLAFEKETFDDDRWEKQFLVGPSVSTRLIGKRLKLFATMLFGVTDDAKQLDGFLILASGF